MKYMPLDKIQQNKEMKQFTKRERSNEVNFQIGVRTLIKTEVRRYIICEKMKKGAKQAHTYF